MLHYPPSTKGGATCYLVKVAVSFAAYHQKEHIVGWFRGYLHTSFFSCCLSLSLSRCPWQTLQIYARTADSSPGWVSALATVGTHGNMRGAMEGGKDRGVIWPQPKAPVLVSWHWERCFRWWHMMITQQLVSLFHCATCRLQRSRAAATVRLAVDVL